MRELEQEQPLDPRDAVDDIDEVLADGGLTDEERLLAIEQIVDEAFDTDGED